MFEELMSRLRPQSAVDAWTRFHRARSFHAELRDPCIAAHIDRLLASSDAERLCLIRPLKCTWAVRYAPDRVVRGFLVAADVGLCRAFWVTCCPQCNQRSVQSHILLPLAFCHRCQEQVTRCSVRPAELVFSGLHASLQDGLLSPQDDPEPGRQEPKTWVVPVGGWGLLRPDARTSQLEFTGSICQVRFARTLPVLPDGKGPRRVNLCPKTYPAGGLVVHPQGVVVVRNPSEDTELIAQTVPMPDPERIGEPEVVGLAEYTQLFG